MGKIRSDDIKGEGKRIKEKSEGKEKKRTKEGKRKWERKEMRIIEQNKTEAADTAIWN